MFNLDVPLSADDYLLKKDFVSSFWQKVFFQVEELKISDIHLEPGEQELRVRGRIHGNLQKIFSISGNREEQKIYIDRLKQMANFDTSTTGVAQDRAMDLKATKCRYRLALTPSHYGEIIVLRVIRNNEIPNLDNCNLSPAIYKDILWSIQQKQGFICITGPTGSGKSTTLQSMIMQIDRFSKKVITLEDPVERILENVYHCQLTHSFGPVEGIKSAMRSDPDVILVGEIRDRETASLAFEAAQTGHLVLSTLHTNDVAGTIDRLIGLGVDRHLIADNLLYVSAQRLVRTLCPLCKEFMAKNSRGIGYYKKGPGCRNCEKSPGIAGRVPLIEYGLKPHPKNIMNFQREIFCDQELKTNLLSECWKLVEDGIVDPQEVVSMGEGMDSVQKRINA